MSVGALYQYLPDREAIVAALSARYHARHEALMDAMVGELSGRENPDPVGSVLAAVARLYREQAGARALRARLQSAAQLQQTREHKQRMVAKVQALLATHGLAGAGDTDRVARTLFFAADGVMHEAFADDDAGDEVLLAELDVLLRAYLDASQSSNDRPES